MGPDRTTRTTTLRLLAFGGLVLFLGTPNALAADELQLIITPSATTIPAQGLIDFEGYMYNASKDRVEVAGPQAGFKVVWTLHDICKTRPDREGTDNVIGTHTLNPYGINSGSAIRCGHLGVSIDAEPGDVVEFCITIERKLKSGAVQTIRSNSILMYRPKSAGCEK